MRETTDVTRKNLLTGDCRELLAGCPDDFFSACITDPPYNYEFIGHKWDDAEVQRRIERVQQSSTLVKNIPYGSGLAGGVRNKRWYEANRRNILEYGEWCRSWALPLFRTLRPGAYCLVFNSTRTIAHVQVALEAAGFYARDTLVFRRHSGIPKGLNAAKKLRAKGREDWHQWMGWHSCLRNEWEAICVVQKPLVDNYLTTLEAYGVGLLRAQREEDGPFQSNILEGFKNGENVDDVDGHCTVKPLALIKFLLELTVHSDGNHVVVDPFMGSGTTCVAAAQLGLGYCGIDINARYVELARERLSREASVTSSKTGRVDARNALSPKQQPLFGATAKTG